MEPPLCSCSYLKAAIMMIIRMIRLECNVVSFTLSLLVPNSNGDDGDKNNNDKNKETNRPRITTRTRSSNIQHSISSPLSSYHTVFRFTTGENDVHRERTEQSLDDEVFKLRDKGVRDLITLRVGWLVVFECSDSFSPFV